MPLVVRTRALKISVPVFALLTLGQSPGVSPGSTAETSGTVARIERLQGDVGLIRGGVVLVPKRGDEIARRDRISTGDTSRVGILFPDGSRLLLGAHAEAFIEDYLPQEGRQRATIMLEVSKGPFRLVLTETRRGPEKQVLVKTNGTMLVVKATDVWAGPIDGATGILSIAGTVQVRNAGGSLVLDRKRQGTMIRGAGINPDKPAVWPRDKIERALTLVAFD